MLLFDEWKALSARISGLREASTLFIMGRQPMGTNADKSTEPLLTSIKHLFGEIDAFRQRHESSLPPAARQTLLDFLDNPTSQCKITNVVGNYFRLQAAIIELCAMETELTHCLSDREVTVQRLVERAFLHLKRTLVVDEDAANRWQAALAVGETRVEKLGGVHLLSHGIWAFKSNADGERTDLILGHVLSNDREVAEVAAGLVLTEWKVARDAASAAAQWAHALYQARRYTAGALAGYELRSVRYLVLVTRDHVIPPEDIREGPAVFRHVNIPVSPSPPSRPISMHNRA